MKSSPLKFTISIFSILLAAIFALCAIAFYPRKPTFDICTGRTAWRTIIEDFVRFDLKGSFLILFSMYNPNPIDIKVIKGTGNFSHNGVLIGMLNVDSIAIKALAISDHLISATFDPPARELISIVSEFGEGTLDFQFNAEFELAIPSLFDYEYKFLMEDINLDIGTIMNTTNPDLCKCTFEVF